MTVYIDVVIGVNFVMNYLILKCVRGLSGCKTRKAGIFRGALSGALYALFMFEKSLSFLYRFPSTLLVAVFILFSAFRIKNNFIKLLFYFYITSFAFSGAVGFVGNILGVVIMENGMFYTENSMWLVLAVGFLGFFIIRYVMLHMKKNRVRYGEKTTVSVCIEGKTTEIKGMLDTGNSLLDPITLYPVIVVEYESIKSILPAEIKEFMKEGNDLNCNINRRYLSRIRLIPCNAVGNSEILKGFRPDYIKIEGQEGLIEDVIIAVIYKKLSANDEFTAIMHPMV